MKTFQDLIKQTNDFFDLHWPQKDKRPQWSEPWNFLGEIPNTEKQACYVLMQNDYVVYIGIGAGNGTGIYMGAGLGSRLHKYWRVNKNEPILEDGRRHYKPSTNFEEITSIATIAFEEYAYLASALESFLINKLNPPRNKIGKNSNSEGYA